MQSFLLKPVRGQSVSPLRCVTLWRGARGGARWMSSSSSSSSSPLRPVAASVALVSHSRTSSTKHAGSLYHGGVRDRVCLQWSQRWYSTDAGGASLVQRLQQDMVSAMKAKDKPRLAVVRAIRTKAQYKAKELRVDELDDASVLKLVQAGISELESAVVEYKEHNRDDLVASAEAEIGLWRHYLPAQLTDTELNDMVDAAIASCGATSMRQMGSVMGQLTQQVAGRADLKDVSALVKQRLSQ